MSNQKDITDRRMRELNTELKSLKTLITQRMASATSTSVSNYFAPFKWQHVTRARSIDSDTRKREHDGGCGRQYSSGSTEPIW